ncbi:hypothetical protein ATKI12_8023 [Kitasatospora sp. Ki12]|uniref:hypothetical protein n=1 Tax=Kitasatospora xanthocidica TaxID=83382 RepID=UPI0019B73161|nr:hypothetical protein [Kitasatospora xanthocidica]GHF35752.1 hypothetical protein GCM10018790_12120 [Kitasatospora xanthocidica]
MVQAVLNLVDRVVSGGRKADVADAYCACPAGTTTHCSGENLYVTECCSWNCAVKPSCVTYVIVGGC